MSRFQHVFALVPDCHVPGNHYATLWSRHFYQGLRAVVPRVTLPQGIDYSWARRPGPPGAPLAGDQTMTSEKIATQLASAHANQGVDAVFSYCFSGDIDLELVRETVRRGIPWINFFCDSTHRFDEVSDLARVVSLTWHPEHGAIASYRALGARAICLPYAMNPAYLPQLTCETAVRSVAFIGVPSANRITRLGALVLRGIELEIRGHGWRGAAIRSATTVPRDARRWWAALAQRDLPEKIARRCLWPIVRRRAGAELSDEEFGSYVTGTQIVLGLNQGRDAAGHLQGYLKFRDVEFPGYGTCYLTEYNEDIASLFEAGREVITFQDASEAARQIRFHLKHPDRRRQIGLAARKRVLGDHTWKRRLEQLADAI